MKIIEYILEKKMNYYKYMVGLILSLMMSILMATDMLPAPSGVSPCGDTITVINPEFVWDYSGKDDNAADTYRIRVSKDAGFSSFLENNTDGSQSHCGDNEGVDCWTSVTSNPSYSGFSFELGTYYWQARAGTKTVGEIDGKGGGWSDVCDFTVEEASEEEEEEELTA
ncbi:hypothetical protein QUF74_19375 [Candidatus Halobeggiatoa sp. HSG11]|nr:hypothetical protein [Candidatus Halobeggiatoa sp. HSG11]